MVNRFFLRLLAGVAVIIGILLLIGTFLPRQYSLTAELEMAAPRSTVFSMVNDLNQWQQWSSYNPTVNPDLKITPGPKAEGLDASFTWSEPRGSGKMWITRSEPEQTVAYSVDFANFPRMESTLTLVAVNESTTKVSWSSTGKLPSGPFYGWFGMYFSGALQADYQLSLIRLKKLVERRPGE